MRYTVRTRSRYPRYSVLDWNTVKDGCRPVRLVVCRCHLREDADRVADAMNAVTPPRRIPMDAQGTLISCDTPLVHIDPMGTSRLVLVGWLNTSMEDSTWHARVSPVLLGNGVYTYIIHGTLGEPLKGVYVLPVSREDLIANNRKPL